MIKTKEDYLYYLEQDRIALGQTRKKPRFMRDEIWRYQIILRKNEYYTNCNCGIIGKVYKILLKMTLKKQSIKLGFTIPLNVFREGLSIAHYGTIVVNENARIGKNCRIHEGVTIGATSGNPNAAKIGDNVFIGSGAKIIGDIKIGDNIAIGANSVVVHDFEECNITIAGIPGKKISNKGSENLLLIK